MLEDRRLLRRLRRGDRDALRLLYEKHQGDLLTLAANLLHDPTGAEDVVQDPVERLRLYVRLLDKADRFLGEQLIDGRDCVGFEISAAKYGDNPPTWLDCIWFDKQTRLPVRIEQSGRPVTGDATRTFTTIQDQFDYAPQLPADTFVPQEPPEGFINAHPDELQ